MSLMPPKWPVSTPITRAPASLWDRCIVALPMWQTVPRNVVAGAFTTTIGSPALVTTPRGYGLNFNGVNQGLSFPAAFTSSKITVSFMFRRMAQPASTQVLFELSSNFNLINRSFSIFLLTGNIARVNILDQTNRRTQRDFTLPPVGQMAFCTATFEHNGAGNKGAVGLWIDGTERVGVLNFNDDFAGDGPFTTETVYIAARNGIDLETMTQVSSVMVHDRLLSEAEIKLLHADPYQMFALDMGALAGLVGDASAGAITASLAASEVGHDSASAAVSVAVSGALAGVETGADDSAIEANVSVSGVLDATDVWGDSLTAGADVAVSGALAATEAGDDVISVQASILISAAVSAIEAGTDSAEIVAAVRVAADMAVQEVGADVAAISMTTAVGVLVQIAAQEAGHDTAAMMADVAVSASALLAEAGNDTAAMMATVAIGTIIGAIEDGADAAQIEAAVAVTAQALIEEVGADQAAIVMAIIGAFIVPVAFPGTPPSTATSLITGPSKAERIQ